MGFALLLACAAPACATVTGTQSQPPSTIDRYTTCRATDPDLVIAEVKRRPPEAEPFWEIPAGDKKLRVSVIDGYRVMYGSEQTEQFFANVKVEKSQPGRYPEDKATIQGAYRATAEHDHLQLRSATMEGISTAGIEKDKLNEGGTISSYTLFGDADDVLVTIYFLNQSPPQKLKSFAEYERARDQFVGDLARCMATANRPKR